jgi:hypothetical protein
MKKSDLIIINALLQLTVAACFILSCSPDKQIEKNKNTLNNMNLKGKVKSVTETVYNAVNKSGKIQKGKRDGITISNFNINENLIKYASYNSDDSLMLKRIYEYDEYGRLLVETHYWLGRIKSKHTYTYDGQGHNIKEQYYASPPGPYIENSSTTIFKYDNSGNIIEKITNYENGSSDHRIYSYDNRGNIIKEKSLSRDFEAIYSYDENNNCIGMNYLHSTGNDLLYTYKYDEKGNMLQSICNVVDRRIIINFKYEQFDRFGNWLIKTQTGADTSITEREIEYY